MGIATIPSFEEFLFEGTKEKFPPSVQRKIDTIFKLYLEKYTEMYGDDIRASTVRATYATKDILNMYKGQEKYLDQLLADEIEDMEKAKKKRQQG